MPLTTIEREMTKAVVRRFIKDNDFTTRRSLLRQFKENAPQALERLVRLSVLNNVGNSNEHYLPRAIAFQYCGDSEALRIGKSSVEVVLRALRAIFEQELEQGTQNEYSPANIELEAKNQKAEIEPGMVRIGLFLAQEFGVLAGFRVGHAQTVIEGVRIGERILTIGDIDKVWVEHIRQCSSSLTASDEGLPSDRARPEQETSLTADAFLASSTSLSSEVSEGSAMPDSKAASPGVLEASKLVVEAALRALCDKPSRIDLLEFGDYVQALIDLIQNPRTQMPLTIAIDGPWGSGKTTLMEMMKSRLDRQRNKKVGRARAHTVWFNAWKYDREESLWAALALEILSQLRKQDGWPRLDWQAVGCPRFGSQNLGFYPTASKRLNLPLRLGTFLPLARFRNLFPLSHLLGSVVAT